MGKKTEGKEASMIPETSERSKTPETPEASESSKAPERPVSRRTTSDYVKIGLTVFLTFVCCIFFFFFLYRYSEIKAVAGKFLSAGASIIIGLVLAYLLNPVMCYLEKVFSRLLEKRIRVEEKRKKTARVLGIVGSIVFLIAVLAILIAALVPSLLESIQSLMVTLPEYITDFTEALENRDFGNEELNEYIANAIESIYEWVQNYATTELTPLIQTYITQITSGMLAIMTGIVNFIIGIIVAVYVMMTQEKMIGQFKKTVYAVCKPRIGNLIMEILRETDAMFGGFFRGKLVDSLIMGIVCYVGCLILKMPNAFLIAVVIGVTNIIPFFGPFIGAIPCIFLILVQYPVKALYFAIFILALQQVDGNIIGPRILGNSTGLSSFWVMVAILIGGGMFGFPGMVLGVPVMGVLQYLVRRIVNFLLDKNKMPMDTEDYFKARSVNEKTNKIEN